MSRRPEWLFQALILGIALALVAAAYPDNQGPLIDWIVNHTTWIKPFIEWIMHHK